MPSKIRHRPILPKRWLAVLGLAVLAFGLVAIDVALKTSSSRGYLPESAKWVAVSDDFGAFWQGVEEADVFRRVAAKSGYPLQSAILSARKAMGIRLTPARWDRWFGKGLLAAQSDEGIGLCLRPGLLMRCWDLAFRGAGEATDLRGVRKHGGIAYGWRDGFLVLSRYPEYVAASLNASSALDSAPLPPRTLSVAGAGDSGFRIVVTSTDGFPIEGTLPFTWTAREEPLSLGGVWQERPLLSISGSKLGDFTRLVRDLTERLPVNEIVQTLYSEIERVVPDGLVSGEDQFSLGVMDVAISGAMPIPLIALVVKDPAPLDAHEFLESAFPYEWNGVPGSLFPLFGEEFAIALQDVPPLRLIASQESLLARAFGEVDRSSTKKVDFMMRLDWARFTEVFQRWILNAADEELLPRLNRTDVNELIVPYLEMLLEAGELRIEGESVEAGISFEGFLAYRAESDAVEAAWETGS